MANKFNCRATCLLVSITLLLSGCANTGSSLLSSTPPDSRLTTSEQAKFFSSSGAQGCGLGALTGAGLGALVGAISGNSKRVITGALIGGAAGCAAGMTANYYLDSLQKDYATTSDRLQAMDKDIKQNTADLEKATATMKQVISDNQATLTKISLQKDTAGFDKASAIKELSKIDANIKVMKDKIKIMKEKDSAYKIALQGQQINSQSEKTQLAALNKEYNQMSAQITALESEADGLFNQRQAISLG